MEEQEINKIAAKVASGQLEFALNEEGKVVMVQTMRGPKAIAPLVMKRFIPSISKYEWVGVMTSLVTAAALGKFGEQAVKAFLRRVL